MRTPLTYSLVRSLVVLLLLALLAVAGAGLVGIGPVAGLRTATLLLIDLFEDVVSTGVWQ